MKTRRREILQALNSADGYITAEEIARLTASSVRTIHRDLDSLERSLSYRDIRLERRRGFGVKLLDKLPKNYLNQTATGSADPPSIRPMMMLLYLLLETDWVKLSRIAADFFISDSSVSGDLKLLEGLLPAEITILRQKGVGVRIQAEEAVSRKFFVESLLAVFPPHRISMLIFTDTDSRGWFSRALKVRERIPLIEDAISSSVPILGMTFSPHYQLLLTAYLLLMYRRIIEGGPMLIEAEDCNGLETPPLYRQCAQTMISVLFSGNVPKANLESETGFLATLLCCLEPSGAINTDSRDLLGGLYTAIKRALELTLGELEEQHRIWLHDDHQLIDYLRVVIAAALHRMELASYLEQPKTRNNPLNSPAAGLMAKYMAEALNGSTMSLNPDRFICYAKEAILALEARLERRSSRGKPAMMVKIICYEGMGMTNYLRRLAVKALPAGTRFNTDWVNDMGRLARNQKQFNLLISTFPIADISIPHVLIAPGMSQTEIIGAIRDTARQSSAEGLEEQEFDGLAELEPGVSSRVPFGEISFSAIMDVLRDFTLRPLDSSGDIIGQAISILKPFVLDESQLREDFQKREEYGSLVFEEYGIQLLHCRTAAISAPRAALLQAQQGGHSLLVMAAPPGANTAEGRVLSEIVLTLSEDSEFPSVLAEGSREDIQQSLMRHFSQLMG
ncbi:MAG: hypothetical protein B0D92_01295 [Spirochaeta sp. LUC14_002_19_P3]|nr:MAG: hypothetical protein B0D92_01295 [Spirochaeta sp. LUC14_002_19_P3]